MFIPVMPTATGTTRKCRPRHGSNTRSLLPISKSRMLATANVMPSLCSQDDVKNQLQPSETDKAQRKSAADHEISKIGLSGTIRASTAITAYAETSETTCGCEAPALTGGPRAAIRSRAQSGAVSDERLPCDKLGLVGGTARLICALGLPFWSGTVDPQLC